MSEHQNFPGRPEQELSDIERYVLDMGNRFSEAVRTDQQYTHLQDRVTALDYDIAKLGAYPEQHDKVADLQQQRVSSDAQLSARRLILVELWEESHGDQGAFTRLVHVEDLRKQIEADPEKTELLDEYRLAKADLDAYRYSSGVPHPSSE